MNSEQEKWATKTRFIPNENTVQMGHGHMNQPQTRIGAPNNH
jgi:hypothetical protein